MNTDTDAFAAYFEAWKPGDPVLGGWSGRLNGKPAKWIVIGDYEDSYDELTQACDESDTQALTGVLVVELARRGYHLRSVDVTGYELWQVRDAAGASRATGPTPLCALVAARLGVNK